MDQSPPQPEWRAQLRAQGRSMTWLAGEVGVERTYLADIAAGRKHASADLEQRITLALRPPDRLSDVKAYATERARWLKVRTAAQALAAAIDEALGES